MHSGQINERLEGRTRLTHSKRCAVELILAAAAKHSLDIAGFGINSSQCQLRLSQAVLILIIGGKVTHSAFSSLLHIRVKRGVDFQAALIEGICTNLFNNLLGDHIKEIGTRVIFLLMRGVISDFFCFGFSAVCRRNEAIFHHLVNNQLLTSFAFLGVFKGIEVIRAFGNSCQRCGFSNSQILHMLAKVILGSTFNAVSTLTEINTVQIHGEDFILRVFVLELFSNKGFLNLADNRALLSKEGIFGELLGNSTAALDLAATQGGDKGTRCTTIVDAAMLIEAVIFYSNKCTLRMLGNLINGNRNTTFL